MTTAAPSKTTLLFKSFAHVTVVALCTASSLALLGAVPSKWATERKATKPAVASVAKAAVLPQLAAITTDSRSVELLQNNEIVVATPAVAVRTAPQTRTIKMEVTAYCPCTKCCGPKAQGITASGKPVSYNDGKFVAADTSILPFGKRLVIPGYADNAKVEVIDRGGAIKGNKLDLYFPTHQEALVWGRQHVEVTVYE